MEAPNSLPLANQTENKTLCGFAANKPNPNKKARLLLSISPSKIIIDTPGHVFIFTHL